MVKPVILISSCVKDRKNGNNDAIRQTWGKASVIPYKFFIGDMDPIEDDEVGLPGCPDNYFSLPQKTQESLAWAIRGGYTHMFRAFTDTYIDTGRLLHSGFERAAYIGNPCGFYADLFMHGGPGYWLSAAAAQHVVMSDVVGQKLEDYWVGKLMQAHKIYTAFDFRYSMGNSYDRREGRSLLENDIISEHLSDSGNKYNYGVMLGRHKLRFPF
jgi:hypothetical protein